jgi:hypothetical protein
MKLAYVDESGDSGQSDVFVMAGLLVDAYRLKNYTVKFDATIKEFLTKHPGAPKELKTKALLNGTGGWNKVDPEDRKKFVSDLCDLATDCSRVYALAFSFANFGGAIEGGHGHPFGKSYWLGAALFIASLIQQKMQEEERNKGLTVLICDDNKHEMSNLSDSLHEALPWFDPIYQKGLKKKGRPTLWREVPAEERLDHIVNTAFAIKSHHSSFIQVADAVCYAFRRHIELEKDKEGWDGEKEYFSGLVQKLEGRREHLGRDRVGPCIEFYRAARHEHWAL